MESRLHTHTEPNKNKEIPSEKPRIPIQRKLINIILTIQKHVTR